MKPTKSITWVIVTVAVLGLTGLAFAHGGGHGRGMMDDDDYGYGYSMMGPGMMGGGYGMMGNGYGYGMMGPGMMYRHGGYGRHMGYNGYGDLSKEDRQQLQQAQDNFYQNTRKLRNEIRDKQFALNDEMGNDNPDAAKLSKLQKELSQLRGEFDQKALDYELSVRKILPDRPAARNFNPGYGPCSY